MDKHRLVVIGDSISQGFMSGAISRPEISTAAWVADAMGFREEFLTPTFAGQGGLPLNLHDVLSELSDRYGEKINWWELPLSIVSVRSHLDRIEDYWERGRGSLPTAHRIGYHNLAVWGFEVRDAWTVSEGICRDEIEAASDNWFKQVPENAMYRTARHVLNSDYGNHARDWSQIENARQLAADGGIENLVVALGANNILGAVTSLSVRHSTLDDLNLLPHQRTCNVYLPAHFEQLYRQLADQVRTVNAKRVFLATVPHVTIPPVTRGVGAQSNGYFEYYTRPWVWDTDFDKNKHAHLTRAQIKEIDKFVDKYNKFIFKIANDNGWHVFDLCKMLDDLAFRRSQGNPSYTWPSGLVAALKRRDDLKYLVDGADQVRLDTRYPRTTSGNLEQLTRGGLISLDAIHPTTVGYGLAADCLMTVMKTAGASADPADLDWDGIVAADVLLNHPPALLATLRETLGFIDSRGLLSSIFKLFD